MNQRCVEKDKNASKLAFKVNALPKISEMLGTHPHKKFSFEHYQET